MTYEERKRQPKPAPNSQSRGFIGCLGFDYLIISAIYLYFATGYYTLLPTTVTLLYSQLLYLTVSLPAIRRKCHAPRHYRFKLCFSWIRTPLGQDGQQIEQIPIDIKLISFCCFDDAHNCCACSGSFFRVAKKEILSVDDIRLHRSFG